MSFELVISTNSTGASFNATGMANVTTNFYVGHDLEAYHAKHALDNVSMKKLANSVYCPPEAERNATKFQRFCLETGISAKDLEQELQKIYNIYSDFKLIDIEKGADGSVKGRINHVCNLSFFTDLDPDHRFHRLLNKMERSIQVFLARFTTYEFKSEAELQDFVIEHHARKIRDDILKALYSEVEGKPYCDYPYGFDPYIFKLDGEDDTFVNKARHFVVTDLDRVLLDGDNERIMGAAQVRNVLASLAEWRYANAIDPSLGYPPGLVQVYNRFLKDLDLSQIEDKPFFFVLRDDSRTRQFQEKLTKHLLLATMSDDNLTFDQGALYSPRKNGSIHCDLRTVLYLSAGEDRGTYPQVVRFETKLDVASGLMDLTPLNPDRNKPLMICPLTEYAKNPFVNRN